ncbi:MAG: glycosyltransferase family 39 protein [Flavobacteriales bacterium]|nr:glycosyltransferase family 39 protein [Flavobacteriales bacterium]
MLWLTVIALLPRLVAALFSGGYFASDDHFLVIEAAGSWVQAPSYNTWMPWNQPGEPQPSGHSLVYVGLHYLFLSLLWKVGLTDPKVAMVLVRLLHAIWSLVAVRTGYRIALRWSDEGTAWQVGLFLALFCFMPFLAVRNLVEVVVIPLLTLSAWWLVKQKEGPTMRDVFIAGLWVGLAINIRFQTIFFAAGAPLVLLFRQPAKAIVMGLGILIPIAVLQGGIDLFIWGRPFAEITEYVRYNLANPTTYFDQPWYNYLLLLAALYLPPFSLAVFTGFWMGWRRHALVWLPVLLFLAAHSWFPNKQERFILPIITLFFILGLVNWELWRRRSTWWQERASFWKGVLAWTWGLNMLLLLPLCLNSSKQSRVDAMYLLREAGNVRGFIVEDTHEGEAPLMPLFYLGQWQMTVEQVTDPAQDLGDLLVRYPDAVRPNVILFFGLEDLEARQARAATALGRLEEIGRAEPGLLDKVVHWLNPINRNETIVICRITDPTAGLQP